MKTTLCGVVVSLFATVSVAQQGMGVKPAWAFPAADKDQPPVNEQTNRDNCLVARSPTHPPRSTICRIRRTGFQRNMAPCRRLCRKGDHRMLSLAGLATSSGKRKLPESQIFRASRSIT